MSQTNNYVSSLERKVRQLMAEVDLIDSSTRPRRLQDERPPEFMREVLFWDGVRWEVLNNWEGDGWEADYAAGHLDSLTHWLPMPEPPQ